MHKRAYIKFFAENRGEGGEKAGNVFIINKERRKFEKIVL